MPTLAGFLAFLTTILGITTAALPANSPFPAWAFYAAMNTVNPQIQQIPQIAPPGTVWSPYEWAVYNLAADKLVNFCPDQPGQTFFTSLRASFNVSNFLAGVVSSSGDQGTNQSLEVPDALKGLLLGDLQNLKTPWGRAYLEIAMNAGSLWGLS